MDTGDGSMNVKVGLPAGLSDGQARRWSEEVAAHLSSGIGCYQIAFRRGPASR